MTINSVNGNNRRDSAEEQISELEDGDEEFFQNAVEGIRLYKSSEKRYKMRTANPEFQHPFARYSEKKKRD